MKGYHLSNVESLRVEPIKLGYIFPMPITLFGETAPMGKTKAGDCLAQGSCFTLMKSLFSSM